MCTHCYKGGATPDVDSRFPYPTYSYEEWKQRQKDAEARELEAQEAQDALMREWHWHDTLLDGPHKCIVFPSSLRNALHVHRGV